MRKNRLHLKIRSSIFTLIELLVVIAIIAILAAILMPALSRARSMGYRISCNSNQNQLMKGLLLYADDYAGYIPAVTNYGNTAASPYNQWTYLLTGQSNFSCVAPKYINNFKTFYCPANNKVKTFTSVRSNSYGMYASYRDNDYLNRIDVTGNFSPIRAVTNQLYVPHRLKKPSATMLLADTATSDTNPPGMPFWMWSNSQINSGMTSGSGIHLIHDGIANSAFFDGHTEAMKHRQMRNDVAIPVLFVYGQNMNILNLP